MRVETEGGIMRKGNSLIAVSVSVILTGLLVTPVFADYDVSHKRD